MLFCFCYAKLKKMLNLLNGLTINSRSTRFSLKSSSFFQCKRSWRFSFIEKLSKYADKLEIFLDQANVTLIKTAGLEHICFKSWLKFQLFKELLPLW